MANRSEIRSKLVVPRTRPRPAIAGAPIFVRSFSSVLTFARDYDSGLVRLRLAGWHQHQHVSNGFVSTEKDAICWFANGAWNLALRHRTARFDPMLDRGIASPIFGQPRSAFVVPTTIVVPLVTTSMPTGENSYCLRIYPPASSPSFERHVLDELVEFRICTSELDGDLQTYIEANFGGARYTAAGNPRRAVYLPDHRLSPKASSTSLVARVLMYMPQFVKQAGYKFDITGKRGDLIHVGSYGTLPRHGSLYSESRWPAPTETVLLAFEAGRHDRLVPVTTAAAAIAEVDESARDGHFVTWRSTSRPKTPRIASLRDALRVLDVVRKRSR